MGQARGAQWVRVRRKPVTQATYSIANAVVGTYLPDLNNHLAAIVSHNSGSSEPGTTFAGQFWYDSTADPWLLKVRDASDAAWATVFDSDGNVILDTGDVDITVGDFTVAAGVTQFNGLVGFIATPSAINTFHFQAAGTERALFRKNITASTIAIVEFRQDHETGAVPCVEFDQDDVSEGFFDCVGSDRGVVPTSTVNSVASFRVEINGTKYVVAAHVDQ